MMRGAHHALQQDFAAALSSGDAAACPTGLTGEAAARFRIYRNNVQHGLSRQLAEAYPVVQRLAGDAFFFATARAFIHAHPPRSRSLVLFGGRFPSFLAGFAPAATVPYLADVARLERGRLEALHAVDAPPLSPAAVSKLNETLPEMRFFAHPAGRIVVSDFPIVEIWRANQSAAKASRHSFEAKAQGALITRPGLGVEVRALLPAEATFGRALFAGATDSRAFAEARRTDSCFDVTAAFRTLLAAGALVDVDRPSHQPDQRNNGSLRL